MRLSLVKQDDLFSCGVFALHTLLFAHGYNYSPDDLRTDLKPTPDAGTSHDQITEFLSGKKIPFWVFSAGDPRALPVPCLVNYQWDGDGHYGVIVDVNNDTILIANPGNGELDKMPLGEFWTSWYSTRYGEHWALRIL